MKAKEKKIIILILRAIDLFARNRRIVIGCRFFFNF